MLIATFTILNLFIAIIVNAMQTFTEQENRDHMEAELRGDIPELRQSSPSLRE
jgi:voltage-gated sodium channel